MKSWREHERDFWRALEKQAPDEQYRLQYRAFALGSEFKGLTKNQQRDFDFCLADARKEKCFPNHFCVPSRLLYRPATVEEWYWLWDTHGFSGAKELPQPDVSACEGIKQSKEFVNWTIRAWVEDATNLPAAFDFSEARVAYPLPWVWKAFKGQLEKRLLESPGFISTFFRNNLTDRESVR